MNYFYSLIGAFLMAFAIGNVLEPMQLVTGGISGLSIIVKEYSAVLFTKADIFQGTFLAEGIPLWMTSVVLNVPLFLIAFAKKGWRFVTNSLWGAFWLIFFLGVIPRWNILPRDSVLNTLFGGLIEGCGLGFVLMSKASTGGVDLLASVLHERYRNISIPYLMAMMDSSIVLLGFFAFGIEKGLYALIAIFIISKVSDAVIGGFRHSHIIYIIADRSEQIAQSIMEELNRGITGIAVKGMYHDKNRTMLMCVTSKKQIVYVKEIVAQYDMNAFVIITDARETLGEGFRTLGNPVL